MSKFSKTIKAISLIIRKPYLLNNVINAEEEWKNHLIKINPSFGNGLPVVKVEQMFEDKEYMVDPFTFTDGGSLITDILLLKNAAAAFEKCSFFEFGTWRGESVANVASVAKECFTINLSFADMKSLGLGKAYTDQIALFSKALENVTHIEGNSLHYDYQSLNKTFDLVFIDGNHHYKYVKSDTENTFKHLIHDNSVVIWHDYAYNPEKTRYQVMAGIIDGTPKEKHKNIYHAEGTMCAVYIPKDLIGTKLKYPKMPESTFKIITEKNESL